MISKDIEKVREKNFDLFSGNSYNILRRLRYVRNNKIKKEIKCNEIPQ